MLKYLLDFQLSWYFVAVVGFFTVFIADVIWVLYIRWSTQGRQIRAGIVSAALVFNGWVGLLVFIGNPYVAIPAEMLGAFCGTVVAIKWDHKKVEGRYVAPF